MGGLLWRMDFLKWTDGLLHLTAASGIDYV